MARGDLSMERIVLGAALGIGAVAAAPFTGGGSVLGAATLAGSLSGIGTGLAAVTAGIVGAAIADGLGDEADYDAYFEGYEEAKTKYATKEALQQEMGTGAVKRELKSINQAYIKPREGRASVTGGSFSVLQNVACQETRKIGYVIPYC